MTTDGSAEVVRSSSRPVLLASATSALAMLPVWLIGGLAVEIRRDLVFTEAQLGLVTGAFMAAAAMLSIPAGVAVKRRGWSAGMRFVALVTGIACCGVALIAGNWVWLLGLLGVAGLSQAASQPSANVVLLENVPLDRQGFAFGIKQAAIPIATLLSGLAVPLIGVTLGWRWAFAGAAGACVWLLLAARPGTRPTSSVPGVVLRGSVGRIAASTRRPLVILGLGGGLGTAASNSLGAFTVVYAASFGLSSSSAGLLLAGGSVANIASRLALGRLADTRGGDPLRWVSVMMFLGAVGFATMASASSVAAMVVGVLIAFTTGWGWNGLYHLAIMRRYVDNAASATGVIGTFLAVGGTVGPIVCGVLAERQSFAIAWAVLAATGAAAGILIVVGGRAHARSLTRDAG